MRPKADPATDNWSGIQDAKKRKQIQDRLAQRARRQRLAKAEKKTGVSPRSQDSQSPTTSDSLALNGRLSSSLAASKDSLSVLQSATMPSEDSQWVSVSYLALPYGSESPPVPIPDLGPGLDHSLLPLPHLTVYLAMYTNGRMLGIPCVMSLAAKSRPTGKDIPVPLHPTTTQLNNVHFLFVDRFPLPRLRDRMIELQDNFSAEEFIADLFTNPSFLIRPGYQGWDPAAWAVAPTFKKKWEFLFR